MLTCGGLKMGPKLLVEFLHQEIMPNGLLAYFFQVSDGNRTHVLGIRKQVVVKTSCSYFSKFNPRDKLSQSEEKMFLKNSLLSIHENLAILTGLLCKSLLLSSRMCVP
uniref:Uncharacterized protein n=1 Tax=Cacopsylla melanoneura TaxID=428564 RepID=A0A8D9FI14_9HEMI